MRVAHVVHGEVAHACEVVPVELFSSASQKSCRLLAIEVHMKEVGCTKGAHEVVWVKSTDRLEVARRVAKVQPDVLKKSSGLDSKWVLLTCEVEVRDIELVLLHEVPEVRSDLSFLRSRRCRQGRAVKSEERGFWRHLKQEVVEKLKSPKLPRSKKSYEKPCPNGSGHNPA